MPRNPEQRREAQKRYRERNKEKIAENHRRYILSGKRAAWRAVYNAKNAEILARKYRAKALRAKYRMTEDDVLEHLIAQNGVCAICGTDQPKGKGYWHIDHSHKTGRVRGLLCASCNLTLGRFEKNPRLLEAMVQYLRVHDVET